MASLNLTVNGDPVEVAAPAHWTLLEVLRYRLNLTGSKQGCDKGDCGSCTVHLDGKAVLSCLTPAFEAEGRDVQTVERLGLGTRHALLDAFERWGAAQCGFCTPGMLMSAAAYLEKRPTNPTREEVAKVLSGNLCRCTGYVKILDAVSDASTVMNGEAT